VVKQLTQDEKTARAAEELRALIREAHEAAKGLREVVKAAEQAFLAGIEAIDHVAKEQIQPQVDAFAADMSAMLTRFCNRATTAFGDALVEQLETWNQEIHELYKLPEGRGLVIDMREEMAKIYDADSAPGLATLAGAQFSVVINPRKTPSNAAQQ